MSNRAYRIIFILLSSCIVCILLLQAYWIRSFYLREAAAFDHSVYTALERLSTKIQDRKKLQAIKTAYFIMDGDTVLKAPLPNVMQLKSEQSVHVSNTNGRRVMIRNIRTTQESSGSKAIAIEKDSMLMDDDEPQANLNVSSATAQVLMHAGIRKATKTILKSTATASMMPDLPDLIDKMIMEIKVLDSETGNRDTLSNLIRQSLANQGLFLPFEFSIRKLDRKKKEVVAQSERFSEQAHNYSYDLSANNVIHTGESIALQFPGKERFMMAGIKSSLLLSLFFSLLILSVFYYVMRLLLRQKKLSEIKNDFVNNMTHELKTPIATMSLALDGMSHPLMKQDPMKMEEYTRILKEENQKLNRHVERVLQMALLDRGELQLHKTPLKLANVIGNAIKAHALQIKKQQAQVQLIPSESPLMVEADELHLTNVFANLIDNALKYCAGHCIISITIIQKRDQLLVSFKDNGIGIDASQREKIFERFYRVQGGDLHDVKGFGLGLSYVRSVVEAHNGSIELYSEKGKGSEFIITLNNYAG